MMTALKRLGIFYAGLLLVVAFLPMQNLWFLVEQKLVPFKLFVNESAVQKTFVQTKITDAEVYFEDIKALDFEAFGLSPWLLYSSVVLQNAKVDQALKEFLPLKIEQIKAVHTVFYPHKVFLSGQGDFGKMSGQVDLYKKTLRVILDPTEVMKTSYGRLLGFMRIQKDQEGRNSYVYERTF